MKKLYVYYLYKTWICCVIETHFRFTRQYVNINNNEDLVLVMFKFSGIVSVDESADGIRAYNIQH